MPVIQVKNLVKTYKTHKKEPGLAGSIKSLFNRKYERVLAVNDISFEISEGELVGFIGPNGAGKTTTLKCLSGLLYPTSGIVEVLGYKPFERKNQYLRKIALVMGQKNQLWWDLPAIDSFLLNKEIYEIPDHKYKQTLDALASLLEIQDILNTPVRKLSLGQRMKCELIAALIHSPNVLFLDEPTIGLDVVMQKNLRDFIRDYNKTYNSTIILTSHYMEDVRQLCKRVIIIDHGAILYDGALDAIVKEYTQEKLLKVTFTKPIEREKITQLGIIKEFSKEKVTLAVSREKSNQVAAHILEKLPVEDLNIEEADIEDIIREVFSRKIQRVKAAK